MKVYVINKRDRPLMPTTARKARLLLKFGKATIHRREPFTIKLIYGSTGYTQPGNLGIDAGYKSVGFSAVNSTEELIGGEVKLLERISERLAERRQYRRQRRNRLRHRQPRFNNRCRLRGWLAPSIQHKLDSHHKIIKLVKEILPIKKVTVEVASFDLQKIKNPDIEGKGDQQGEQLGFSNLREYILHRDNHKCQNPNCKNKAKQPILQVHHLGFWNQDRSDRPSNLITLCSKCHTPANHKPGKFLHGWKPKLKSFKPETFMTLVWRKLTTDVGYEATYGYITKDVRREYQIEKSHHNDAFVIAGGTNQRRIEPIKYQQVRRNKRSIEQFYDAKYIDLRDGNINSGTELFSGRRTRNKNENTENLRKYRGQKVKQGQRRIKVHRYPYSQHDLVLYEGKVFSVIGMQNKGKGADC
ncbi:RNA-guided endonuclease IscB [Okeania sp. SIO1I7]|uniref:RNA-guided endonuclease IscB n=1 Tax=Okeania sp. SIO1I7 TaxID=2607772 RepID=UPI0013FC341F|nr:RNA-guided endonuclease IscB [Okeania sp. SIO1I7]NET29663.1 paclitaxel/taxanoid biosynthesis susceptibility protein TS1 [Okeania sp. SIO1I7]